MNNLIHIARAAALAGVMTGCIVWSAAAFAADGDVVPQGKVAVHGADFTSPRDVAHLQRQVERVARNICLGQPGERGLVSHDQRVCYDTAVNDGLAQIASRQQQALRDRSVRLAASQADGASAN
jgi:UrcA family protein